ncbi:TonB-dependent receptor [Chishuiella sp.]|uniref:TonB-dependent receptor n=1 Tax=Chishuiella sp. TaxID=1969467 RepID=UPI0028A900F6|nr:TonB-dependent receptor [Chishuiella sp.]
MIKDKYSLKNIFLLGSLFGGTLVFAQTKVTGTVEDINGPVENAIVNVKGTNISTTTDSDGIYELVVDTGKYSIVVSKQGELSKEQSLNVIDQNEISLNFILESITVNQETNLNEVVLVGSRSKGRTQLDSTTPIDIIDIKDVTKDVGQVSLNQILNYVAPSFSSNTQVISDGTDHIDPASLRGLGPDQVLVLINGKRRHTTSLININGAFGKGSVGTDLNAIPTAAIKRIEILRDGAAAQYGSDAIAGVINIVLEDSTDKLRANISYGGNLSRNAENSFDGETFQANVNYGAKVGTKGGFVNFSGSYDKREPFNRQKEFTGTIFTDYNRPDLYPNPTGVDITDAELARRGESRSDYVSRIGQSKNEGGALFFNSLFPVSDKAEVYAFGGLNYRLGESAAFRRQPSQLTQTVQTIFPNGYLPLIQTNNYDRSLAVGIRGEIDNWKVDFSNTYGNNTIDFNAKNTVNASMLASSPTSFEAGGYRFTQNTTNLDFSRFFDDILAGINVAFGAEYRFERYQIVAGEEASYTNYGKARQIGTNSDGTPIYIADPKGDVNTLFAANGSAIAGGAQAFPGFLPENAVNATRNSVAAYLDTEFNFTKNWLVAAAGRYENYSDFGSTINGKLSTRYKIGNYVLRAAASTGFRAPSLHQMYFSATSSVFQDGVISNSGTFTNDSREAQLLGIPKLKQETSKSVSAGATANWGKFKLSIDGYFIRIDDRIIYTGAFTGSNSATASDQDKEIYQLLEQANATSARFFANAINTETKGLDIVLTYQDRLGRGKLRGDLSATFSKTNVVGGVHASELLKGKESTYFDRSSKIYLESAVPRTKINLSLNYTLDKWNVYLRNVYFGPVDGATNVVEDSQVFTGKVVTDLSFGYAFNKNISLTVGANNLLDVYPDKTHLGSLRGAGGYFVYSRTGQQFGTGGRFAFARLAINL